MGDQRNGMGFAAKRIAVQIKKSGAADQQQSDCTRGQEADGKGPPRRAAT
jgi:hypothetical protein